MGKIPDTHSLLDGDPKPVSSIIFDSLDANDIHQAALHTHGAASPSGRDAYALKTLLLF